jgi:hypothetical protein
MLRIATIFLFNHEVLLLTVAVKTDDSAVPLLHVVLKFLQIGDSIVRKSRETLERAIHLVENNAQWGAKVVYGDTDRYVAHFVCVCGIMNFQYHRDHWTV